MLSAARFILITSPHKAIDDIRGHQWARAPLRNLSALPHDIAWRPALNPNQSLKGELGNLHSALQVLSLLGEQITGGSEGDTKTTVMGSEGVSSGE